MIYILNIFRDSVTIDCIGRFGSLAIITNPNKIWVVLRRLQYCPDYDSVVEATQFRVGLEEILFYYKVLLFKYV